MTLQTNRTGKPGAVQIGTLKVGDVFSHDTNEVMVATAEHRIKALKPDRKIVEVCCFCDSGITGYYSSDWYVFKK